MNNKNILQQRSNLATKETTETFDVPVFSIIGSFHIWIFPETNCYAAPSVIPSFIRFSLQKFLSPGD